MLGLYVPQCSISFVELGIYSKVHLAEARQKQWGVSLGTIAHPRPALKHKKKQNIQEITFNFSLPPDHGFTSCTILQF